MIKRKSQQKFPKKLETSLSFIYENIVTERTNLRPVKTVQCDERVPSLAQIDNFSMSLSEFCSKSMRLGFFTSRYAHA